MVCTANICRSPAAASLLAGRVGRWIDFTSRGTQAIVGAPQCAQSANIAMSYGGAGGFTHASRQLEVDDIRNSTLILAMSSRHRAAVIGMRPSAQVRTYTLEQAARIIRWRTAQGAVPPDVDIPDRLLWLAEELDTYRGTAPQPARGSDDIRDPHRGHPHAESFQRLVSAVNDFCRPLLHLPGG